MRDDVSEQGASPRAQTACAGAHRQKGFFQRHSGIEALVNRFVDGAHAALPELAHDVIPALEDCLWRQHPQDYTRAV